MIKAKNLSAGYSNHTVLDNLSFSINDGGVLGILGPNGSGKTTLLKVLAGILPYTGNVSLNDNELKTMKRRDISRHIAMMPQFSSLYFSYSVFDTVMLGRYVHRGNTLNDLIRTNSKEDKEIVEKALETTGLKDLAKAGLKTLSGGQLQRVYLARTIAQGAPIILLDEPTNHLDLKFHIELMEYLSRWSKETTKVGETEHKNTVITVFHDIGAASMSSDNIILLKHGTIIKKGPTSETLTKNLLENIYETDVVAYYSSISDNLR